MKSTRAMRSLILASAVAVAAGALWADDAPAKPKRHISPVNNAASQTQAINETKDDTSRINAAFRARSSHVVRENGTILYIDSLTGEEWIDSTNLIKVPKMKYPLIMDATVGVDLWNPAMRAFGQKHGLVGFWADVNLHNRYFPAFEAGLGQAKSTPAAQNFTYSSPMSVYFKIGIDYNFLYNSNPDYKWFVGARYGFAPFKWGLPSATPAPGYWGDLPGFTLPDQSATAGWMEFSVGLRVKLWKNISAGWRLIFHSLIHESKNEHGKPWYIPGYGTRGQSITGSFSLSYTLPLKGRRDMAADAAVDTTSSEITGESLDFPAPNPLDTVYNESFHLES